MAMSSHKRRAEDDLQNEQRLAKRFDLLNLVQETKHRRSPRINGAIDSMQLDDTKDRVYIHNLDDEISDTEAEEERLVFLPDIEKKLAKIPKSILLGEGHPHAGNEMILYRAPYSLSIPEEHDKVRKAIIESRARARQKQLQDSAAAEAEDGVQVNGYEQDRKPNGVLNMGHVPAEEVTGIDEDEDAMDLG
ncbi:hypothetical protein P7C71_g2629, partial [Lecanoromycetidae sp. Uapishka_2]